MPINHAKRIANQYKIGIVISLSGLILGFALFKFCQFIFSLFILSGLIFTFVFLALLISSQTQASRFDQMINSGDYLAYWICEPAALREEHAKKSKGSIPSMILLTLIYALIGGIIYFFFGSLIIPDVLFCVLISLFIFGYFIPKFQFNQMLKSTPEILIGIQGAWIMNRFIQWNTYFIRIQRVYFNYSDINTEIAVEYIYYQRTGWLRTICKIPVPKGKEQEAERVALRIASANRVEYCPVSQNT